MTVKELKKKLEGVDESIEILIYDQSEDFTYTPLENIQLKKVVMSEHNGQKIDPWTETTCLIFEQ